ncbi:MAG: LPXTG cell wall anchor domain-containing protein [Clostridiaceae bacterium]|nr:LPXTG cell wall anchor domain-containing protein [Bacillota bacterium]NLN51426.1 LPXTG cell wall anchor domain-containing protein [Clostridiaceae bacterium]
MNYIPSTGEISYTWIIVVLVILVLVGVGLRLLISRRNK